MNKFPTIEEQESYWRGMPAEGRYAQAEREEAHRLRMEIQQLRDELSDTQKERDTTVGALKLVSDAVHRMTEERDNYKEAWDGAQKRLLAYDEQVRTLQRFNDNQRQSIRFLLNQPTESK